MKKILIAFLILVGFTVVWGVFGDLDEVDTEPSKPVVKETIKKLTKKEYAEKIKENMLYTADQYNLGLYEIFYKDSVINVCIDNYKGEDVFSDGADQAIIKFLNKYALANKGVEGIKFNFYISTSSIGPKNWNMFTISIGKIFNRGYYVEGLTGSDYFKEIDSIYLFSTENTEKALRVDTALLKKKGYKKVKFGTIHKFNYTDTTSKPSKPSKENKDKSPTNYDPNDYGDAMDYDNPDDFYYDHEDELDYDDAEEIWDYWN